MRRLRTTLLLTIAPAALAMSVAPPFGRFRSAWGAALGTLHHLMEPPILRTQGLAELTNTGISCSTSESDIRAFVARPAAPPVRPLPILLVVHEFFGLNEGITAKAQLLADELGCLCIAPDTYRGVTTTFIPRAILLALTTPQKRVNADLDDVVEWAAKQPGVDGSKVAVLGFCYGGGKAIRYTTQARPTAATAIYYGSPVLDVAELRKLRAPVCAVYGTEDMQFPQRTVDAFKAALEEADVEHEVVSYYGVGHAFWTSVEQIEEEAMPQIAAYRLTTNSLRNFFEGKESFARKRAFLEFMLAQRQEMQEEAESSEEATEASLKDDDELEYP